LHIATIVAGLDSANKKGRDNAGSEAQHGIFHDRVRSLLDAASKSPKPRVAPK
jgi:hypothetical protein